MEKGKKLPLLNIILAILFILLVTYITVRYASDITRLVSKPERFRHFLTSYGPAGVLVFISFQVLQIIISVIPGEVVQIAGGYVYGTVFGTVYSMAGVVVGCVATFYISRFLGFGLVKRFVSQKNIEKFNFLINSPKSEIIMFLLFLIPGIPKDMLVYIAGLTPIKPLRFFIIVAVARFPALLGSSFIGANLQEKDYISVIVVSVIACILFVVGILMKDKIIGLLNRPSRKEPAKYE